MRSLRLLVLIVVTGAAAGGACASTSRTTQAHSVAPPQPPFTDLQGTILRSWAPEVVPAKPAGSPVEREFERVAERARAGHFGEGREILDHLAGSPAPRVRLESLVFRAELERYRLAYIGGGYGKGQARLDHVRNLVAETQSKASMLKAVAALPPDDRREADLAVQLETALSLATDLPSWLGFLADQQTLNGTPATDQAYRGALEDNIRILEKVPGVHVQLEQWVGVTEAGLDLAEGKPQAAIATLSSLLKSASDPCLRAEIHLRIGDCYIAPFGPVEMLGQNPVSEANAVVAMRASILIRGSVSPSSEARQLAAAEYEAATGCASAGVAGRRLERQAFLRSLVDPKGAAESYDTAAKRADDAQSTRDALRLHTIAALLRVDTRRLLQYAGAWARGEDLGGQRSILALVERHAAWLAEVVGDLRAAREILETFNEAWTAAGRAIELVDLRSLLAMVNGDVGLLDAAMRFDDQAAEAERLVAAEAERLEREIPSEAGQVQMANADLSTILSSLVNRLGLLRIDDDSPKLKTQQESRLQELERLSLSPAMRDAASDSAMNLVELERATAERRKQLDTVRTCAQRAELLAPKVAAATGLGRAELLLIASACRADWLKEAQAILDKLEPMAPFEAAVRARNGRTLFQAQNAVESSVIDVQRAFRAAAKAQSWQKLSSWAARLYAIAQDDPSMGRYRRFAAYHRGLVQLHTGAVADALKGLEQLRAESGSLSSDSEVEVGELQAMAEAYVAAGDPLRGLWAEAMRRIRTRETNDFNGGLRPRNPLGAELAGLDRKYALVGSLSAPELQRLAELERASRATRVADSAYPSIGDLASLVAGLAPETLLEVFDLTGQDALVWCVRRGDVRAKRLPKSSDYWAAEVGAYWVALVNDESDRRPRGRNLFDNFVNACHLSDGEGLVIVGVAGPLDHALEPNGEVIERRSVVRAEELWERSGSISNETGTFVLGVNSYGLRAAETEAAEVARILGATPASASRSNQAELLHGLDMARYVHIAADGHVDPTNPYASFLSLGPSQRIEAWELFRHASRAQLLTLSACDTGALPTRVRGYSFASLAHLAGAKWVMSSQWRVNDPATEGFMSEFYRNAFEQQAPLAEAFRTAKRWAKNKNEGRPSVYAPFKLSVRSASALL